MIATGNATAELLVRISLSVKTHLSILQFSHSDAMNLGKTLCDAFNYFCMMSFHLIDAWASLDDCKPSDESSLKEISLHTAPRTVVQ